MSFQRVFSGAPWERTVGYCRALRSGDRVFVTGTAPVAVEGGVHAPGDAYAQAKQVLANIEAALQAAGARLEHVVRTRMYVVNIDGHWEAIGRAHGEAFSAIRPASTMVEVARLIDPRMLVDAMKSTSARVCSSSSILRVICSSTSVGWAPG